MARFTPSSPPKPIEVDQFFGINEAVGDTEVKVGEALEMVNWRITQNRKLEKRGGHTTYLTETQPTKYVQGMWYGKILTETVLIFACNGNIRKRIFSTGTTTTLGTMTDARTRMFYFGSRLYFMNGTEYKYYDGTTFGDVSSIAYVPTVAIGAPPAGGGTLFEELNNLTGKKKQEFVGDGASADYVLAEAAIDSVESVYVDGVLKTVTTHYTVNLTTGTVTFTVGNIPASAADVGIAWTKSATAQATLVTKNKAASIYGPGNDTTIFIWGNPDQKHRRTFSGTLDPTYWPVNNFTLIGSDQYAITDIQPQYDRQIIFKEDQTSYSTPEFISALNKYDYPVYPLNYTIGNVCFDGAQVCGNNPVTLANHTVWEWVNTQIKDERNATNKARNMVKSFANIDFTTAVTFDNSSKEELWINVGTKVYIWNYGNDTWYIYDNIDAVCFLDINGVVYYGTKIGTVESFKGDYSDNGVAISADWIPGFVDFGAYEYLKNSRNMWVSLQPSTRTSITIKCPTNRKNSDDPSIKSFTVGYVLFDFEDIDFADFSFNTNRNPQTFRIPIKAKKYTTIQFRLSNHEIDEPCVVLSFKVECELGSYAK